MQTLARCRANACICGMWQSIKCNANSMTAFNFTVPKRIAAMQHYCCFIFACVCMLSRTNVRGQWWLYRASGIYYKCSISKSAHICTCLHCMRSCLCCCIRKQSLLHCRLFADKLNNAQKCLKYCNISPFCVKSRWNGCGKLFWVLFCLSLAD